MFKLYAKLQLIIVKRNRVIIKYIRGIGNQNMAYIFQSNYNYTTKIRQLCSRVIFVHIVLISCNFVK